MGFRCLTRVNSYIIYTTIFDIHFVRRVIRIELSCRTIQMWVQRGQRRIKKAHRTEEDPN